MDVSWEGGGTMDVSLGRRNLPVETSLGRSLGRLVGWRLSASGAGRPFATHPESGGR